ncbi:MAG: DUF2268 domain-containing putative Zn-dependent protease [Phycisphaerae bacterium]|nr:DUF2268 domain-containing putative Zn-dependent protease [Phycisphaerae bacterium]
MAKRVLSEGIVLKGSLFKKTFLVFFLFAGIVSAQTDEFVTYEVDDCRFKLYNFKLARPIERAIVFGVSLIMDSYRQTFGFEFPDDFKVNVTIICGKDKFLKYQQEQLGKIISESGYYSGKYRETVALLNKYPEEAKNARAIQTMVSLVFHESNHMILRYQIPSVPNWINEGLSEYFEGFKVFGADKRVYLQRRKQNWCKYWVKNGFPTELDKLLNMSHREFYDFDKSHQGSPGYTMGYSLVYFMMSGRTTETILKEILWDMKRSGKTGKIDSVKVINDNFPGGLERFERQWKMWIPTARGYRPLRALRSQLDKKRSLTNTNDSNNMNN